MEVLYRVFRVALGGRGSGGSRRQGGSGITLHITTDGPVHVTPRVPSSADSAVTSSGMGGHMAGSGRGVQRVRRGRMTASVPTALDSR